MDRSALADFLRRRRGLLQPTDVGLGAGSRRRTTGLRREEVAQLATMSVDYYTRLEQQRGPQPSPQMLSALARALRLTADERDYLYRVAGHQPPDRFHAGDHVSPVLLRMLDQLSDTPALILSPLGEKLAQNRLSAALFGDRQYADPLSRSEIFRWFAHPDTERAHYPAHDHQRQSRAQVANLRAALGSMGPRSRAAEMVRELSRRSPEFLQLWEKHEVAQRFADHKTLLHPEVGALEVDCQVLFTEDQSQALLVLTAAPRSDTEEKLKLLAVLGTQTFPTTDAATDPV